MRVVIIVEGGVVQNVFADDKLDYLIIDKDCCDEDESFELQDVVGNTFTASLTEYEATACEDVEHYYNQIPAV